MDFGVFVEQIRRGNSQSDAFRELFELVDAAEAWGLDVVWLAEMLGNPTRSVLSAPLLVASWIAARTERLRVGTAVQLLPLNHPLRVAGEIATLDHLSHGRFDFGIGRSGSPRAYDALGVPYAESQERFFEALTIILEAWKGETFSHEGKGDVCLRIPVYASTTEKSATEEPHETIMYYFRRQADLTRAPIGRAGTGPAERREGQAQRLSSLSYEEILSTKVAFGTPAGLIDSLSRLKEELALNGIAAELNPGGLLPAEQEMRTLRLLTQQVMPAFK
jgi:luciferase-like monooxygenase